MIKALLRVRFQGMLSSLIDQAQRKHKRGIGTKILFAFLFLYLIVAAFAMTSLTFYSLAEPYHALGLDWMYFTYSGILSLAASIIGGVFTTQSILYDARDNALLLSMPIPPSRILLSRMIPVLGLTLLFSGIVMLPAAVVYAIFIRFSPIAVLLQLLGWVAIALFSQTVCCLLGWLLHLLLSRLNKSAASLLFMVVFLGVYFYCMSQANAILNTVLAQGLQIAQTVQSKLWPLYAFGVGCMGSLGHLIGCVLIATVCFSAAWMILSSTFIKTATMQRSSRRSTLKLKDNTGTSAFRAIISKEFRKFLGCPIYLTNSGMGILLNVALAVAGVIFRDQVMELLAFMPEAEVYLPLAICGTIAFIVSTVCISTPSVSLEGKNIWILKSMPVSAKQILLAKLTFHICMSAPSAALSGLILSIAYGCSAPLILLCTTTPALLAVFCGLLGMITGLRWAKLDFISEAYPCKQSISVLVTMMATFLLPLTLGALYIYLSLPWLSVTCFLTLCCLFLIALCAGLYRCLCTYGVRKWESL